MPVPGDMSGWAQAAVNGWLQRGSVPNAPTPKAPDQGLLGNMIQNRVDYAKAHGLGNVVSVKKKRSAPQLIPLSRPQGQ